MYVHVSAVLPGRSRQSGESVDDAEDVQPVVQRVRVPEVLVRPLPHQRVREHEDDDDDDVQHDTRNT